ncbi:hypothetical protein H632_c2234p1 [Helicosporidium sp. ATCC 50920]|nr:hypothetical protein H632_c2234p1 [Helicosporidium sp. ATCC 50920]|eukprot:KDD73385.1 hypothetical protein H632_c2234p1 [Helicosporidium sp. ATCC 50920]
MRALRDPRWADGPGDGSAQATYVPLLSQAVEATQELARGVEAETAANAALSGAIVRIMDFPVQKSVLLALSYPFFVNANLVAACAALELGVCMEDLELPVGLEFLRDVKMEEGDDA